MFQLIIITIVSAISFMRYNYIKFIIDADKKGFNI